MEGEKPIFSIFILYDKMKKTLEGGCLMKLSDINIRDPFVLVHEGMYYLYGAVSVKHGGQFFLMIESHKSQNCPN